MLSRRSDEIILADEISKIILLLMKNKLQDATIIIEGLLLHLEPKQACEIISEILAKIDYKILLNCINPIFRTNLLLESIALRNKNLIDFFFKDDDLFKRMTSVEFIKTLTTLLLYQYFPHTHLAIEQRKQHESFDASEINLTLTYVQRYFYSNPSLLAKCIRELCKDGANPMAYCISNEKVDNPIFIAIKQGDLASFNFYLENLQIYSKRELAELFIKLIAVGWFSDAEDLLKKCKNEITEAIKPKELGEILYIVSSEIEISLQCKKNLTQYLLASGADPLMSMENLSDRAFQHLDYAEWPKFLEEKKINNYSTDKTAYALTVCAQSFSKSKIQFMKLLLQKPDELKGYFKTHQTELDYILHLSMKIKDDSIIETLLKIGANPLRYNNTALDLALDFEYSSAIKLILKSHIDLIPPQKLAEIFEAAIKHHWDDIAEIVSSNLNKIREHTLLHIKNEKIATQFTYRILNDDKFDNNFALKLCINDQIKPEPLLFFALKNTKLDMLDLIFNKRFQTLTVRSIIEIMHIFIDQFGLTSVDTLVSLCAKYKKDHEFIIMILEDILHKSITISFVLELNSAIAKNKYLDGIVKSKMNITIYNHVLNEISHAKSISEIMQIKKLIEQDPHFKTLTSSKSFKCHVADNIIQFAHHSKQLFFTNKNEHDTMLSFLSTISFNLFSNYTSKFNDLAKGKIVILDQVKSSEHKISVP